MRIEVTNRLSLAELPSWSALRTYRRKLVVDCRKAPAAVWGDAIGVQYECAGGFFTVTHYDYFDGVNHWLYVIGKNGRVRDFASIPDFFGFVQNVVVESPSTISLGFFGTNDRWEVTLSSQGFWSFGAADLARRPNRFILGKRYMALRQIKGSPWAHVAQTAVPPDAPATASRRQGRG